MDVHRAKAIASSPETVNVSYYGVPVYIQHVNASAGTARIFHRDNPEQEQPVPIDSLSEEFNEPDMPFV